jgi:precorrin-2/cobalt-factor-2 C20-methyltransferase
MNGQGPSGGVRISRPTLVGVGVGPGDPELLTLKAVRAIQAADVIFAPVRRAGERSMALEIAAAHIDTARHEVVTVPFPRPEVGESWATSAQRMVKVLHRDRHGAFLTEGDPLLFGSFGDLVRGLREIGADVVIHAVPGISSVTASAAAALLPLTDHEDKLAIIPATAGLAAVEDALGQFECVVLLKVGRLLGEILALLDRLARLEQAVYVRRCGWANQEIVADVRRLVEAPPLDYFALLIVRRPAAHGEMAQA